MGDSHLFCLSIEVVNLTSTYSLTSAYVLLSRTWSYASSCNMGAGKCSLARFPDRGEDQGTGELHCRTRGSTTSEFHGFVLIESSLLFILEMGYS